MNDRLDVSMSESNAPLPAEYARKLEQLKLDALAEFAAGAGHEINNPLAIISGHAQILLRETDDLNLCHHLSVILAQTHRAYEMIADIRLFARPPIPQYEQINLILFLNKFIEEMNATCLENGVVFHWLEKDRFNEGVLNLEKILLKTDSAQLMTVLKALGKNASEAMPNGGKVALSLIQIKEENRSGVQIIIEDNGPGIPEELRDQIFSPYFSGRQSGRGLGFGLSKAWRLLQGLGGEMSLDTTINHPKGCRWLLFFAL